MKKRSISLILAVLLTLQPTAAVAAQSEENSVVRGKDYVIRSNVDGTKTLTFYADEEASDWGGEMMIPASEEAAEAAAAQEERQVPPLETSIEGEGEDALVTMEYGDTEISFTSEIFEGETDKTASLEKNAVVMTLSSGIEVQQESQDIASAPEAKPEDEAEPAAEKKEEPIQESQPAADAREPSEQATTPEEGAEPETAAKEEDASASEQLTETGHDAQTEKTEPASEQATEGELEGQPEQATQPEAEQEPESERRQDGGVTEPVQEEQIADSVIRYRELKDGIKEELVIYGYRGGHRVEYDMQFGTLVPRQNGNAFSLLDENGIERAAISAPYLYDAAGVTSYDVAVSMVQTGEGTYHLSYVPSDDWLADEARAWPVVLDPTITITDPTEVEDNHVQDGSGEHFEYNMGQMVAGNKGGKNYTAFTRPAIPDSVKNIASQVIIKSAKLKIYAISVNGSQSYSFHKVNEEWNSRTITGKNRPSYESAPFQTQTVSAGWNTVNIKPLVSQWFNSLDQQENCGLAIRGGGSRNSYIDIASSDHGDPAKRMKFEITYETVDSKHNLGLKAQPYGNALGSGSGYVNLSWNAVPGAEAYYIGIFNGKEYEYFFTNSSSTSFSTKGKGLWPTEAQINRGRYRLHMDGSGTELPCIPAFTYANVSGGKFGSTVSYYFLVVPANRYGQAINPGTFKRVSTVLPDRIAPNQPASVVAVPSGYSRQSTIDVAWSGVRDYNSSAASIVSTLGDGRIQYSIDGVSNWKDTDKNTASGSYTVSTAGCSDGDHTIYIRGRDGDGNTGGYLGTHFYVDRSGPTGQSVTVLPQGYTAQKTGTLSWSGMSDLNPIARVEYRIDNGSWTDTGRREGSSSGYVFQTGSLADGRHTVSLRGVDSLGNVGPEKSSELLIDRTAPHAGSISVDPGNWTSQDTATLRWDGVSDKQSGIAALEYAIDGDWKRLEQADASGSISLDVSGLSDGEHTVSFRATDRAGNRSAEEKAVLYRDTTRPEVTVTAPADRAILEGVFEIKGRLTDKHLMGWSLTARDSEGEESQIAAGGSAYGGAGADDAVQGTEGDAAEGDSKALPEVVDGVLGNLDLSVYPDGENVTIILKAWDEAGNEEEKEISVIRVGGSMEPFAATLDLHVPELVSEAQVQGTYAPAAGAQDAGESGQASQTGDSKTWIYIDGNLAECVSGGSFLIDGVRYGESSTHTVSAVSAEGGGELRYSSGLGAQQLLEELWEEGAPVQEGVWESSELAALHPMLALRLNVTDFTPDGSSIQYEYSINGGQTWLPMTPDHDVAFGEPADSVRIRAVLSPDEEKWPQLYRVSVQGVIPFNPSVFSVRLAKTADSFRVEGPDTAIKAQTKIIHTASDTGNQWYLDGKAVPFEEDTFDALYVPEDGTAMLSGVALTEKNGISLSGSNSRTLLREDKAYVSGTAESGEIACGGVYAVRLLASVRGGEGRFFVSNDGGAAWQAVEHGGYLLFDQTSDALRLRAELSDGATLAGWHLEGYESSGRRVKADLVKEPVQVTGADYGAFGEKRYELSWQDIQEADETAAYGITYRIYRDGALLGETQEKTYTDRDYKKHAVYAVSKVCAYSGDAPYAVRESGQTRAAMTVMQQDKKETKKKELLEYKQDPGLSSLYGGNYTFTANGEPPAPDKALSQKLLGKNKYCSLGFEPINFNTGNFILEARDYAKEDSAGTGFDMLRTYNVQTTETDGLFGAGWACEYSQYLQIYTDGTIGWRQSDGVLVLFEDTDEGYRCDDAEHCALTKQGEGFAIQTAEGILYTFSHFGLLEGITQEGQTTALLRDSRDVLTAVRLSDGTKIALETDEKGHITKLVQPGGIEILYQYDGEGRLVGVTDPLGNTVRYVYDGKGRMTQWYDAAGNRQAYNEYDGEDRVVYQKDAKDGEYTLQYFEDHTIVTDAEGVSSEIWFDEQKRTVREVDGNGGEYLYAYDEAGNLCGKTDAQGRLTTYAYDENGNLTNTVLPDGTQFSSAYDKDGNLIRETDGNGNETRYEYDEAGRLVKTIHADGGEERKEYDAQGRVVKGIDPLGYETYYGYDEAGNHTSVTDALGHTTKYEYDTSGNMTAEVDALGNRTEYGYDDAGNQVYIETADGARTSYTYDVLGNTSSVTDALGNTTRYEYDALGNLVKTCYPDGSCEKNTWSLTGNLLAATDGNGSTVTYTYDANGNMLTETDALGRTTAYTYDESDLMTSMTMPSGAAELYEYDKMTGLLTRTSDASGSVSTLTYDPEGNILTQSDAEGMIQSISYDCMGRQSAVTDGEGNTTRYAYDLAGNLVCVTDALGNETRYAYDPVGRCIQITDVLGNETSYEYDAAGQLIREKNQKGAVTSYAYDEVGRLAAVTDALGNTVSYAYDALGNTIRTTDADGCSQTMGYDAMGRMTEEKLKNGGIKTYSYDAVGNLVKEGFPEGGEVVYKYDAAGQQIEMKDVLGQTASLTYDALGNVIETVDADGKKATYTYDKAGRLMETVDEAGSKISYTYDSLGRVLTQSAGEASMTYDYDRNGNVVSAADGTGATMRLAYDAVGRLSSAIYPDGSSNTYEYDAKGQLLFHALRDGSYEEYGYDEAGNMTYCDNNGVAVSYEYDAAGNMMRKVCGAVVTQYAYDKCGRKISETDGEGKVTRYEYDAEGNVTAYILPDGSRLSYFYDQNGRVRKSSDTLGNETSYSYDMADRLTGVTDALGNTASYEYDAYDNISRITDALGHCTQYVYNAAGQLLEETDALGNSQAYRYTEEGYLACKTDAEGKKTEYQYDAGGNVTQIRYPDGNTVENQWDAMGRIVSTKGSEGETTYSYDEGGRLCRVAYPAGSTVAYSYNESGKLSALVYPGGKEVFYEYDSFGRLKEVSDWRGTVTSYEYDGLGRCAASRNGENTTEYTYDASGNIQTIRTYGKTELSLAYTYDTNGNLLSEVREENGQITTSSYAYDSLNRLISWTMDDGKYEQYTYDAAGNMTAKKSDRAAVSMEYDAANRLIAMSGADGVIHYAYSPDGNLLSKTYGSLTDTYTYDTAGRLSQYTGYDGTQADYTYSAAGLLLEKEVSGAEGRPTLEQMLAGEKAVSSSGGNADSAAVTSYVYDVLQKNAQVLSETTDGSVTQYTYGRERLVSYEEKKRTEYVYDVRGSVAQAVTEMMPEDAAQSAEADGSGTAVYGYRYTPFGELLAGEDEQNNSEFRYNGEYYDAVVGNYYLRARFYEPSAMRFFQRDIVRGEAHDAQSLNRYSYVQNNPVLYEDPSGESKVLAVVGASVVFYSGMKYVLNQPKKLVGSSKAASKTAKSYTKNTGQGISWKNVVNTAKQSPIVQVGTKVVDRVTSNLTKTQQKAVKQAQEVWSALKFSTSKTIKTFNKKLLKACAVFIDGTKGKLKKEATLVRNKPVMTGASVALREGVKFALPKLTTIFKMFLTGGLIGAWDTIVDIAGEAKDAVVYGFTKIGGAVVYGLNRIGGGIKKMANAFVSFINPSALDWVEGDQPEGEVTEDKEADEEYYNRIRNAIISFNKSSDSDEKEEDQPEGEVTEDEAADEEYYKKGLKEIPDDWVEVEAPEIQKVKSNSFKEFLKRNGFDPKKWVKVVEKWGAPDGTVYQRNYWTNGTTFFYHGQGIEEFFPH